MTHSPDPGPGPGPDPAVIPGALADRPPPGLGATLGPLAFRAGLDRETDAFAVAGRRAIVHGDDTGIREVLGHPFRVAAGPRVVGAGPAAATVTPLGAERRLTMDGRPVTERIVASRDAPVVWMEWTADQATALELEWTVAVRDPGPVPLAWRDGGRVFWLAPDPAVGAGGAPGAGAGPRSAAGAGPWAAFIFSAEPGPLHAAGGDDGGVRLRARVAVPGGDGLRLAMVLARAGDDGDRLFRIAGRTAVALRARAGAADRLLKEGLRVTGSDPALGPALDRDRIDLTLRPAEPVGPWTAPGLAAHGLDRLAAGDFDGARTILDFLLDRVDDDGAAARGVGPRFTGRDDPAAGTATLRLLARWLAWTGDLAAAGQRWPAALRLVEAGAARGTAARELAVVAEELGDRRTAEALKAAGESEGQPAGEGRPGAGSRGSDGPGRGPGTRSGPGPGPGPGDVVRRVVHGVLGAEPDAPRGRLVLRPRLAGDRLEVRGLAVGPAAVGVVYRRERNRHRLEVRQEQGGPPLQLVLEPELIGGRVTAVRVDGEPAELDVVQVPWDGEDGNAPGAGLATSDRRWRVPVQLVLDRPRTLDVDVAPG